MQEDAKGFLYPVIDSMTCVDCGLCEKVCPSMNVKKPRVPIVSYVARNADDNIRLQSSSGGVFSQMADSIIEAGGVVFGVRFNERFEAQFDYAETKEDVVRFRCSKYVQASVGETFKQVKGFLSTGRKVLFSGTPCQVMALKLFLGKEYDNLLTIDFICHGVPSPKVWKDYLEELLDKNSLQLSDVVAVSFRNKTEGWKNYSLSIDFCSKMNYRGNKGKDLYLKSFIHGLTLRPTCFSCPSRSGRSGSDVTLADFWGVERFFPNRADDKGDSSVLCYNNKFANLGIVLDNVEHISVDQIVRMNPTLIKDERKPDNYDLFWREYGGSLTLSELMDKYTQYSLKESIRYAIVNLLCKMHLVPLLKKLVK